MKKLFFVNIILSCNIPEKTMGFNLSLEKK
jgi:hypothetical protein